LASTSAAPGAAQPPRNYLSNASAGAVTLLATPDSVGFPSAPLGVSDSQTIQLKNVGSSTVTVASATISGAGFTITGLVLPLSLPSNAVATFNVVFSPTVTGAVTGSVSIGSNVATISISLRGSGVVATDAVSSSPSSLRLGNVAVGSIGSLSTTLTDKGNSAVTISGVTVSGVGFTVSGVSDGMNIGPSQAAVLTVDFAPQGIGVETGSVTITSNATDSPSTISVSGTGIAATDYSVSLGWTASTSSGVTGYNVYRSITSAGPFTNIVPSPLAGVAYTDNTVAAGQEYYYYVTSVNSGGEESTYSNQIAAIIP
jgi:hypothetical protein